MAVIPLDVATRGLLDSPLSVSVDGYLSLGGAPVPPPKPPPGGGGRPVRGTWEHPYHKLERLQAQLEREDEEILAIIMAALKVLQ